MVAKKIKRDVEFTFYVTSDENVMLKEKIEETGLRRSEFFIRLVQNRPVMKIDGVYDLVLLLKKQINVLNDIAGSEELSGEDRDTLISAVSDAKKVYTTVMRDLKGHKT